MFNFKLLLVSLLVCLSFQVSAKRFATGYTEFELPVGWECYLEGTEYVCQSENEDRKKEAIIILAAKKRGSQDTKAEYKKYLEQPRSYTLPGNKKQISEPKHVKTRKINNHEWIDALHLASEVPGFYTRYLATVKAGIGVAVTFSVTKSMYDAYKGIFDKVIASMRVFAQENPNLQDLRIAKGKGKNGNFQDATFVDQDGAFDYALPTAKKEKKTGAGENNFLFLIVIGVVAFLVILRMKNKKGKKK